MSLYPVSYFPLPKAVKFFPSGFLQRIRLPFDAELDRSGSLLVMRWKHRDYTLAITREGIVVGYHGKISPTKAAAICIVLFDENTPVVFDGRFHTSADVAQKVREALEADKAKKASNLAPGNFPYLPQLAGSGEAPSAKAAAPSNKPAGAIRFYC